MIFDFFNSMKCLRQNEVSDYKGILDSWAKKNCHAAFMPAIFWYGGTYNLFEQKAVSCGENLIWIIPAGQAGYGWIPSIQEKITKFYDTDEIELSRRSHFPGIPGEKFEECILLHSSDLQNDPKHTVLGANVLLVRLTLSSGSDTLLLILLDHQNTCWEKIVEKYRIRLDWLVDSGRGMEDYFTRTQLYQLMKRTPYPEVLPSLYFKGLANKGEIPENFQFSYAMLSQPNLDGYDKWRTSSAVYSTGWNG